MCLTLRNPMDCSLPGSPSMGFSRQEYWSRLTLPSQVDLPDPRIKPGLLHCGQILYQLSPQGSHWRREWRPTPAVLPRGFHGQRSLAGKESNTTEQVTLSLHFYLLPTGKVRASLVAQLGKKSACNAGDLGLTPGLGRSPGEGKGTHSSILAWRIPRTA